ncbi:MAG TPA: AAA family ATPase [Candidatus Paceibacterota bacterium]|nr:AAA family ATPase [Candidatus Paceibacterota bacterium]
MPDSTSDTNYLKNPDIKIRIYVTGTNGSGKGEVGKYLKEKYGFDIFNVRALLEEIGAADHIGLHKRPDLGALADSLRDKHGGDYLIRALTEKAAGTKLAVFDSVRCPDEVDYIGELKKENEYKVMLVCVDADPAIRHERVMKRKSITDTVSFEDFIAQENAESVESSHGRMNVKKCMLGCDLCLLNNGDLEAFHREIEEKIIALLA